MPLITTIAELQRYISIDANTNWETIEPYVKEAELLYLKPLLGKEFYDEFLPLYEASVAEEPVALSEENTALLPYIQKALAYYALLKAIPNMSVKFGESGIRQDLSTDSVNATKWQQEQLLVTALNNGDTHADKLLEFLEENEDDYATWLDSAANTRLSGLLVYSTAVASKHIKISESRRIFLQLLPDIKKIEAKYIPKLVGMEQYDELITQLINDTVSAENRLLLDKIEPIIAKRVLHMRLPFMQVTIGGGGIFLFSEVTEFKTKDYLASAEQLKALRFELCEGELGYAKDEQELTQFILDNIDDYPLIKASTIYTTQPSPGPTWMPRNDPDNKHFNVGL